MQQARLVDFGNVQLTDAMVVKRVIGGEKELFEILMRRYNQKLYRVVRSYLLDENDVEDAMQETYLKAFDKLSQFQGLAMFSTWLIRIGINEALQRLKKNKRYTIMHDDNDLTEDRMIQIPDDREMSPEKLIITHETKKLIESAIDSLPEKYRIVYTLRELEEMQLPDIATILEITENNVKVRLHRAKALLKEALYDRSVDAGVFEFGNARCTAVAESVMKRI